MLRGNCEIIMHYFKRNIGDYHKKAGRLNMLQHGAYTLLIDACYDRERFPSKDEAIDWCWASSSDEIAAVEFVLLKFFDLVDGTYRQNRIAEEIEQYHATAIVNARIAQEREAKKRVEKARSVNAASTVEHESPPNQEPLTINQEPLTINQHQKEIATDKPVAVACKEKRNNGSRLSGDWALPDDWFAWTIEQGLTPQEAYDTEARFRDYWIAVAGSKGVKLDWAATWRTWIRRNIDSKPKKIESFAEKHTDASWADGISSDWKGNPL